MVCGMRSGQLSLKMGPKMMYRPLFLLCEIEPGFLLLGVQCGNRRASGLPLAFGQMPYNLLMG